MNPFVCEESLIHEFKKMFDGTHNTIPFTIPFLNAEFMRTVK